MLPALVCKGVWRAKGSSSQENGFVGNTHRILKSPIEVGTHQKLKLLFPTQFQSWGGGFILEIQIL